MCREDNRLTVKVEVFGDSLLKLGKKGCHQDNVVKHLGPKYHMTHFECIPGATAKELYQAMVKRTTQAVEEAIGREDEHPGDAVEEFFMDRVFVVFWNFNEFVDKNGFTVKKVSEEVMDDCKTFVDLLKRCHKVIMVGPGQADLWKLEPEWDKMADNILAMLSRNGVPVINPVMRYRCCAKRDSFHFNGEWNNQ